MPISPLTIPQIVFLLATFGAGLAIDVHVGRFGQTVLSAFVWAVLFFQLARQAPSGRAPLLACLLIATAGEIFLSLVWGLYTYRLDNIPLFVPPGHVLLLLLGMSLAARLTPRAADLLIGSAGAYSLGAAIAGIDTLGLALFAILLAASVAMPDHRRLYAATFVLALVLELVGTGLGNWSWKHDVPATPLVTTNPPFAAGAFYGVLDMLVALTMRGFARSAPRRSSIPGQD